MYIYIYRVNSTYIHSAIALPLAAALLTVY